MFPYSKKGKKRDDSIPKDGSCSKSSCLTVILFLQKGREKERKSECMIHTVVYQDKVGSVGITKCWFKCNKPSDEYDSQAIILAPLCLIK